LHTSFSDEREQVVYEMATCLANSRWVSQGLYDRVVKALGHVGITDVITLMGYYTSVSMTLAFYDAIAKRSPPVRAVGTGLAIALLQFGSPDIPEIRVPAALIMDP
jgi:hypothetical protein